MLCKKGETSTMRLIIDARESNIHFLPPPSASLLTSEGLSRIEIEIPSDVPADVYTSPEWLADLEVIFGLRDIKDAFHRFKISE